MFVADLYAQSVLSNKTSALELSRKFIKSTWLVGYSYSLPSSSLSFESISNELWLRFVSDLSVSGAGFAATWEAFREQGHCVNATVHALNR